MNWLNAPAPATEIKLLDLQEWKALVKSSEDPATFLASESNRAFRLSRCAAKAVKPSEDPAVSCSLEWCFSDESIDRGGDKVSVAGWNTDNFVAGGCIPFGHDYYSPPVARPRVGMEAYPKGKRMLGVAEFPAKDLYEFGHTIGQLALNKFLRTASVGFIPHKWEWVDEPDRQFGCDFLAQEMLEWSVVPVPQNANCLQTAKGMGIELRSMKAWAEKVLDCYNSRTKDHLPSLPFKHQLLEDVYKQCAGDKTFSVFATSAEDEARGISEDSVPDELPEEDPILDLATDEDDDHEELQVEITDVPPATKGLWKCANNPEHDHATGQEAKDCDARANASKPKDVDPVAPHVAALGPDYEVRDCGNAPRNQIFLSRRKDNETHSILAHHDSNGLVNFRGVTRALGVLLGVEDETPTLEPAATQYAYEHLATHLATFGVQAPEFKHVLMQSCRVYPETFYWDATEGKLLTLNKADSARLEAAQYFAEQAERADEIIAAGLLDALPETLRLAFTRVHALNLKAAEQFAALDTDVDLGDTSAEPSGDSAADLDIEIIEDADSGAEIEGFTAQEIGNAIADVLAEKTGKVS